MLICAAPLIVQSVLILANVFLDMFSAMGNNFQITIASQVSLEDRDRDSLAVRWEAGPKANLVRQLSHGMSSAYRADGHTALFWQYSQASADGFAHGGRWCCAHAAPRLALAHFH